ncbi:MAG: type II toxin-antitoxin system RatA family toxin [Alcanivoracaceae bacterium]|nr:type II toxin-antitoxin system RatA family toxin [Alcanivoracaceae bacterium]
MHQVNRQAIVRHSAEKMFNLVYGIESYPQFLKWCHDSHLIEETQELMIAGMTVSLAGIKQKFTTKNILVEELNGFRIILSLVKGPFEKLSGYWIFTRLNDEASKIELHLEFNFKSGILNSAFKRAFGRIAQQLVADFVMRANHVYG